ncbi:acetylxylan esterase [Bacillus licheniformis]|nr:acetylxylan esterase [Bacillus licheniformis]
MHTLSYFDVMNLAQLVKATVLMSIGLVDTITPPSTVFAAYNHLETDKEIKVYRYLDTNTSRRSKPKSWRF